MSKLEKRGDIVIPGEELASSKRNGDFTLEDDGKVKAGIYGVKNEKKDYVSVIPLAGRYMPKEGDMVVGIVTRVTRNGWLLDINGPYNTYLPKQRRRDDDGSFDLRRLFAEGDLVSVKIIDVNEVRESYCEGPRKLRGGRAIVANAKKIPRIIGSKKSMLTLLRDKTGCKVVVGQNGIIWIDGPFEKTQLVVDAINKIENESHTKGLTDRISEYLDEGMKKIKNKD